MNEPAISARLLRSGIDLTGPSEPVDSEFEQWTHFAKNERVVPLLHQVATGRAAALDSQSLELATVLQVDAMGTAVRFEHDLGEVAAVLNEAGAPFAVIKGAATAHLDYADPSLRQFGDIDLLVEPDHFESALRSLNAAGWVQAYPLPRKHLAYTHAVTLRNTDRVEIDLHQRVGHRAIGLLIPPNAVMSERTNFSVPGIDAELWALSRHDRLIHACIHAQTSRGVFKRLSSTADVLVIAHSQMTSPRDVIERADQWRVRNIVETAIRSAYLQAALSLPGRWRAAIATDRQTRDRLVDRAYLGPNRKPMVEEIAYVRLLPGWQDRARYLTGYFSTGSDYARENNRGGLVAQSRYLVSRLRSGRTS